MADLVSPCHGAELFINITYDDNDGNNVTIWCGEPTCYNTWDDHGKSEDREV